MTGQGGGVGAHGRLPVVVCVQQLEQLAMRLYCPPASTSHAPVLQYQALTANSALPLTCLAFLSLASTCPLLHLCPTRRACVPVRA